MLQNVFASSEHQFANSDSLRYCYYYHFRGQWNNKYWQITEASTSNMAFIFPFNENAPSREDGEKLENIGDRLGKKKAF